MKIENKMSAGIFEKKTDNNKINFLEASSLKNVFIIMLSGKVQAEISKFLFRQKKEI